MLKGRDVDDGRGSGLAASSGFDGAPARARRGVGMRNVGMAAVGLGDLGHAIESPLWSPRKVSYSLILEAGWDLFPGRVPPAVDSWQDCQST